MAGYFSTLVPMTTVIHVVVIFSLLNLCCSNSARHESFYGFTAWKSEPQTLTEGARITFEETTVNWGYAYNTRESLFTCPVSGTYYVSVNLMADNDYVLANIVVSDRTSDIPISVYSANNMGDNTASNNVIVTCAEGETISVEAYSDCIIYGNLNKAHSTFTVMYLSLLTGGSSDGKSHTLHDSLNAFSVMKEEDQEAGAQELITFEAVEYTDGNFLAQQHRYNCSVEGVYWVNFNVRAYSTHAMWLALEKGTLPIIHAQNPDGLNYYNTVSNSALVRCREGEKILLRATFDSIVTGDPARYITTFNGFLVAPSLNGNLHTDTVGCSVYKKSSQNYDSGEVIVFDGVLWNENNLYNTVFSRFDCSVSGIYYISGTFTQDGSAFLYLQIGSNVNFIPGAYLNSEDSSGNNYNTISNSGLIRCYQGEYIQVTSTGTGSVYGYPTEPITTFSVLLMYQI